jgi:hypothetical protein
MHFYKPDPDPDLPLVDIAFPGVEVVTDRTDDGTLESQFHGGTLDGERLGGGDDAEEQHARALRLARIAGVRGK